MLDNLSNCLAVSLNRVTLLAGQSPIFVEGDIRDNALLDRVFAEHAVDAVPVLKR